MKRRIVYIAGPYNAATAEDIDANVLRAVRLARYAIAVGYAPLIVHPGVRAGAYGTVDPAGRDLATARTIGLECSAALAAAAASAYRGKFWCIRQDSGGLSDGCYAEACAFRDAFPFTHFRAPIESDTGRADMVFRTWEQWKPHVYATESAAGLISEKAPK